MYDCPTLAEYVVFKSLTEVSDLQVSIEQVACAASQCYEEARAQGLKFWMERQEGGEAGYTTRCKLERAHKMKAARERLAAWNAVMAQLGGPLSQASGKAQSASKHFSATLIPAKVVTL